MGSILQPAPALEGSAASPAEAAAQPAPVRAVLHYAGAVAVVAFYGVHVCPFIDSLTLWQLLPALGAIVALQYLLRRPLRTRYLDPAPLVRQAVRLFWLELALFLWSAVLLGVFDALVYGFPAGSGLKMLVGFAALGFFIAIDLSLERERGVVSQLQHGGRQAAPEGPYFPLAKRVSLAAFACAIFITGVVFLVINKDLAWLISAGRTEPLAQARRAILTEVGFVVVVFLAYSLNVIQSFSRNLHCFFSNENRVLEQATRGNFDARVPVGTADEFGVMAAHTNVMIDGLRQMTGELQRTRDVAIMSLATLAETRDNETGAHILRTQRYVRALAERLRSHPRFSDHLDAATIELLFKSAPLHDIGKVGIPDRVLLKPGSLTPDEWRVMQTHTTLGGEALRKAEAQLGSNSFLRIAREIATSHHEKWDGSGYPLGLQGERIPVSGRLMALADVYDALISKRVYKPAFSHDKARGILLEGRGSHFDPAVVDAFLDAEDEFIAIAAAYRDADADQSRPPVQRPHDTQAL
jgi:hypothetical protein